VRGVARESLGRAGSAGEAGLDLLTSGGVALRVLLLHGRPCFPTGVRRDEPSPVRSRCFELIFDTRWFRRSQFSLRQLRVDPAKGRLGSRCSSETPSTRSFGGWRGSKPVRVTALVSIRFERCGARVARLVSRVEGRHVVTDPRPSKPGPRRRAPPAVSVRFPREREAGQARRTETCQQRGWQQPRRPEWVARGRARRRPCRGQLISPARHCVKSPE